MEPAPVRHSTRPPSRRGETCWHAGSSATGPRWWRWLCWCWLFVGCYALPPLLPYDYNHLDYDALLQPPSLKHWFGTNALGQDLLARTLRGMQKSMLIGFCVALISTSIAATVGSVAGYFGGWRDRALMWLVDLLLVVPSFLLIAIVTPAHQGVGQHPVAHRAARGVRLDGQLADGARLDDEPARARIRPCGKVYGGVEPPHHRAVTSCRTSPRSSSSTRRSTSDSRSWPKPV